MTATKFTIEDIKKLAKDKGGFCLSRNYINSETKLLCRCSHGHEWWARPNNIKQGTWCPYCAGKIKLTLKQMQQIAEEKGGKCLSEKYINSGTKLLWRCSHGHEWWAMPNDIRRGIWCTYCTGIIKLTLKLKQMQQIARERGGKCLSKKYKDNKTKLHWKCSKGHTWKANCLSISEGHWCSTCARTLPLTIEEMKVIAAKRGGDCLSKEYVNVKTKLLWRCSHGHEWWAKPGNIKTGTWCPYCAGKIKLTLKQMQQIAEEKEGKE